VRSTNLELGPPGVESKLNLATRSQLTERARERERGRVQVAASLSEVDPFHPGPKWWSVDAPKLASNAHHALSGLPGCHAKVWVATIMHHLIIVIIGIEPKVTGSGNSVQLCVCEIDRSTESFVNCNCLLRWIGWVAAAVSLRIPISGGGYTYGRWSRQWDRNGERARHMLVTDQLVKVVSPPAPETDRQPFSEHNSGKKIAY